MHLREMAQDFINYMEAETDEEVAAALADITAGQIEEKSENYCWFLRDLEGDIAKFDVEEKRISAAKKAMKNKHDRAKAYMLDALETAGIASLKAGTFKIAIQNNPPALVEVDASLTPCEFMTLIPERWEKDNAAIKEALKNGKEVPGHKLCIGKSLHIR